MTKYDLKWSIKDLDNIPKNGKTVMSCFAGAGGSSMGYKLAGYDVIAINEIDKKQAALYLANIHPKYKYIEPIQDLLIKAKNGELPDELYNLDILDASFPCTLFSAANLKADNKKGKKLHYKEGGVCQVLDTLAFTSIELAGILKPKVVIFENVKGLLFKKNKWYVDTIYSTLNDMGYTTKHWVLDAQTMGVPQRRKRVFFVSVRQELKDKLKNFELKFNDPIIPIKHLDDGGKTKLQTTHMLNIMKHYRDGDKSLATIRKRLDGKQTGFQTYIVSDDEVLPPLRAGSNDFIVKGTNYRINEYQMIQAQTFPIDYNFLGRNPQYALGMSVPPIMMCKVGVAIYKNILKE